MKRGYEEENGEEEPSKCRREEETILQDLHSNLLKGDLNSQIEKRLFETQKEYFTVYMEKLMHKIPMGEDLVKIIQNRGSSNEFEYMFTAAKSVIQSQMRVKQIKAFHAVFDMVYSLMWRYVHEKVVSPTLNKVLSSHQLNVAYEKYQNCSNMEEEGPVIEMQCLLYCIQEMLESQEPVKIPNPLYSRFTQQMKAMSEYVITILVALSKPSTGETIRERNEREDLGKTIPENWSYESNLNMKTTEITEPYPIMKERLEEKESVESENDESCSSDDDDN